MRSDIMGIKPPNEQESNGNKCFHAETHAEFLPDIDSFEEGLGELQVVHSSSPNVWSIKYIETDHTHRLLENPSEKDPMSIAEFLGKYLDVSPLRDVFIQHYGKVDYHFRYPIDAMIKSSMIRRVKCLRSFQKLVNRFVTNQNDAALIGFKETEKGLYQIPDRRTFCHWENVRISIETLEIAMDQCVLTIKELLSNHGLKLGRKIGIDSMPLESLFNDKEAKYNGHYEKTGYKVHGVYDLEYNIPLAIIISPMNESDVPYFKKLIERLHDLDIRFEEVYADGAYDTFEHFALIHLKHEAQFMTNPGTNAVYHAKGDLKGLLYEYNRLWKNIDFIPPDKNSIKEKLLYLYHCGKIEITGAYFRNQFLQKWEKWIEQKNNGEGSPYNERNVAEGFHGFVKKYLNLQYYFDYKGLKRVERHVYWTYLSILGVVLTRLQNGITENLTQVAFFE